jgi:hypothetical protein
MAEWGGRLTGLTSYVHLVQLESLDISRNQIDSLLREWLEMASGKVG